MAYTEAQKKASIKYMAEKTDDIRLRVPKGLKDKYKAEAEKRGVSMTQFIINCIEKEINEKGTVALKIKKSEVRQPFLLILG